MIFQVHTIHGIQETKHSWIDQSRWECVQGTCNSSISGLMLNEGSKEILCIWVSTVNSEAETD